MKLKVFDYSITILTKERDSSGYKYSEQSVKRSCGGWRSEEYHNAVKKFKYQIDCITLVNPDSVDVYSSTLEPETVFKLAEFLGAIDPEYHLAPGKRGTLVFNSSTRNPDWLRDRIEEINKADLLDYSVLAYCSKTKIFI